MQQYTRLVVRQQHVYLMTSPTCSYYDIQHSDAMNIRHSSSNAEHTIICVYMCGSIIWSNFVVPLRTACSCTVVQWSAVHKCTQLHHIAWVSLLDYESFCLQNVCEFYEIFQRCVYAKDWSVQIRDNCWIGLWYVRTLLNVLDFGY